MGRLQGEARRARKVASGMAQSGAAKAAETVARIKYTNRLRYFVERMNLKRAIPPGELNVLKNLGFELGMTPKQLAETLHEIYTNPKERDKVKQAIAANQQNPQSLDAFYQLAGAVVDVGIRKRVINPADYK
jgi:hypothetical protein